MDMPLALLYSMYKYQQSTWQKYAQRTEKDQIKLLFLDDSAFTVCAFTIFESCKSPCRTNKEKIIILVSEIRVIWRRLKGMLFDASFGLKGFSSSSPATCPSPPGSLRMKCAVPVSASFCWEGVCLEEGRARVCVCVRRGGGLGGGSSVGGW